METARDPFDELTALYLGNPGDGEEIPPGVSEPPSEHPMSKNEPDGPQVTIALCGHLPVMAGLWVTQYADGVAATDGPTGLVRLEGGRCLLEVLRPDAHVTRVMGDLGPFDLSEVTSQLAISSIRRWIICVDDRDAASAVRAGADEVVVLTSAEKTAVIEAYRLAKVTAARAVDPEHLEIGMVLVGTEEAQAARVSELLDQVAARHLDCRLPVRATVRRIDVVEDSLRTGFDESARGSVDEVVEAIVDSLRIAKTELAEPKPSASIDSEEGVDDGLAPWLRIAGAEPEDSECSPLTFPDSEFESHGDWTPPPAEPSKPEEGIRLRPTPAGRRGEAAFFGVPVEPEVKVEDPAPETVEAGTPRSTPSADSVTASPATLLSALPFLRPLDWTIPAAGGVECGCDDSGNLHLVSGDGDAASLHVAAQWVRAQRNQFSRATGVEPGRLDQPVMHVLTTDAPRVADLHRTGIHLHLLIPGVNGPSTLPLNDERNRTMPD
ncbi:MAG: hypothetical protein CMJ51_05900 [Planctomycetaceae bacterium]|nr:hypothetical protein [Planctomycetaceae bacterium]